MKLNLRQRFRNFRLAAPPILILSLLIGAFFRFYNLNWDQGHFFHPDERNIAAAVSRVSFFDQLNPRFFAYGGFPIYLYRALGEVISIITANPAWVSNWGLINLIGRGVSATASSLSILVVFLLGKKVFSKRAGVLAAFFSAFCVFLIQTAHYGVTESLLCFWGPLIALLSLGLLQNPTLKRYLILGIVSGLAIGTKVSAATFLAFPLLAHTFASLHKTPWEKKNFWKRQSFLLLFGFFTLLWFFISSPYTFFDFEHFWKSMSYERGVVSGKLEVCYVYQFIKTVPYVFQIKNLLWLMGPFLTFSSLAGWAILTTKILKNLIRRKLLSREIIVVSWPFVYFAIVGSWSTKFVRYMAPLLPFFCLFAAWLLLEARKHWRQAGRGLLVVTTLTTALYALSFMSIYTHESTRITASKWIYRHVPRDAKILTEHWDDGLPIHLDGDRPSQYQIEALTIYEPDGLKKAEYYGERLATADYLIINSRRLYGTLVNLPERYPITSHYYKQLFNGQLGYEKATEFKSYPQVFGFEIETTAAEETFQVYDHPKVMVFENRGRLNKRELVEKLMGIE